MKTHVFAHFLVIVGALSIVGCTGNLHVAVKVANGDAVRSVASEYALKRECLNLLTQSDDAIKAELSPPIAALSASIKRYQGVLGKLAALDAKNSSGLLDVAGQLTMTDSELADQVGVSSFVTSSAEIRKQLREAITPAQCDIANPAVSLALAKHRALFSAFQDALKEKLDDLGSQISARADVVAKNSPAKKVQVAATKSEAVKVTQEGKVAISAACTALICGGGLGTSNYAYAVASLPEKDWSPLFNQAAASGVNGNVDIVVKMTESADFTVKGMRFDVSKIPEVASKAATQGLLMAAQISGVPISASPQTASQNVGLAPESKTLSDTLAKDAKRVAMEQARQQAIRDLGVLIAGSESWLSTPEGRSQLKDALAARLSALDSLLKMEGYPQ